MKKLGLIILGTSWKTTLTGYITAALLAIQPFLTETVDFSNHQQRNVYYFRVLVAAAIAVMGRQSGDSTQVKKVDQKVDDHIGD